MRNPENQSIVQIISKYVLVVVVILFIVNAVNEVNQTPEEYTTQLGFVQCEGYDNLFYDPNELIVYILFNDVSNRHGLGYMSAYYASNGRPYSYDVETKQLVMIER